MIKKLLSLTLLSFFCLSTAFAVVSLNTVQDNEVLTEEASSSLAIHKSIQNDLEAKSSKEKLSKKEQRLLKKLKKYEAKENAGGNRSWIAAMIISFFLGALGIDRFYLGYIGLGVIKLLTLGGLGLWALIDFILIIIKVIKPKNGNYTT